MDKKTLLEKLIAKLEEERANLAAAALHTYEAATHEESEAEDQYDTRGLEASYLAGAQAKRVGEIEEIIHIVRTLPVRNYTEDDEIGVTALVQLEHDGKTNYCLILPKGGGLSIDYDNHHIQVITPQSPLGEALIGRSAGDEVLVDVAKQSIEYEIVSVG